jgi:hypothetical protein
MKRNKSLAILFLASAILLFGFATFFARAAEVFDGVHGGSPLDVNFKSIPIWFLSLILFLLGIGFGLLHIKSNRS